MPRDIGGNGENADRPDTPERRINEHRAERDAFRMNPANWVELVKDVPKTQWQIETRPLTAEERARPLSPKLIAELEADRTNEVEPWEEIEENTAVDNGSQHAEGRLDEQDANDDDRPQPMVEGDEDEDTGIAVDDVEPADAPDAVDRVLTFQTNSDGEEYGRRIWETTPLTDEQRTALTDYSAEPEAGEGRVTYVKINGYLRGRLEADPQVLERIRHLDDALQIRPVPEDIVVVRETDHRALDRPVGRAKDSIQRDPGYLSAAICADPGFDDATPLVWHFRISAGTPAFYMESVSEFPGEQEILLARGLPCRVYEATQDEETGRWHLYAEVVTEDEESTTHATT